MHNSKVTRGERWAKYLSPLVLSPPHTIGAWMQRHTALIKSDGNRYSGVLSLDNRCCFLKFYPAASAVANWRMTRSLNRGWRSFTTAEALRMQGVLVAQPYACIQVCDGLLVLSEGLLGAGTLEQVWHQRPLDTLAVLRSAAQLLAQLHVAGYVHGDCKWSNLFCTDSGCYLVDLDAARRTRRSALRARDVARFTVNAEEQGVAPHLYAAFLETYEQAVGTTGAGIARASQPYLRKFRTRHKKRYGISANRLL